MRGSRHRSPIGTSACDQLPTIQRSLGSLPDAFRLASSLALKAMARFYGPKPALFDKSWKLGDLEKVEQPAIRETVSAGVVS